MPSYMYDLVVFSKGILLLVENGKSSVAYTECLQINIHFYFYLTNFIIFKTFDSQDVIT
jgi:hypothetical protein